MPCDEGYILLWRKIRDDDIWLEKREFSKAEAWIDMLMEVRWSDEPQDVRFGLTTITCGYGQSLNSLDTWARRWGWSRSKVHRFFKMLENRESIRSESVQKSTRITICNFKEYQQPVKRSRNARGTLAETEERKEPSNKEKQNLFCPDPDGSGRSNGSKPPHIYSKDFERAWNNHGRKDGSKFKAEKTWIQLRRSGQLPELQVILDAQDKQKQSRKWKDGYCPYLQTWLNGRLWEETIQDGDEWGEVEDFR